MARTVCEISTAKYTTRMVPCPVNAVEPTW